MAEVCLECMNTYLMDENNQLTEEDLTMDEDLCEGCGQWNPCVITIRNKEKIEGKGKQKNGKIFRE